MANNIQITQGSGTTMATTDVGGVHHQKTRISWGKNAKETGDVKYLAISASSSGDTTLIAAIASTVIRVVNLCLIANGTVNVKFKRGSTDITGLYYLVANAGAVLPEASRGWFETGSNEALVINLSAAVAVGGHLAYVEEV